jgi:hypothetical protein
MLQVRLVTEPLLRGGALLRRDVESVHSGERREAGAKEVRVTQRIPVGLELRLGGAQYEFRATKVNTAEA